MIGTAGLTVLFVVGGRRHTMALGGSGWGNVVPAADRHAEDLAPPAAVRPNGDGGRHRHDAARLADLHLGGVPARGSAIPRRVGGPYRKPRTRPPISAHSRGI